MLVRHSRVRSSHRIFHRSRTTEKNQLVLNKPNLCTPTFATAARRSGGLYRKYCLAILINQGLAAGANFAVHMCIVTGAFLVAPAMFLPTSLSALGLVTFTGLMIVATTFATSEVLLYAFNAVCISFLQVRQAVGYVLVPRERETSGTGNMLVGVSVRSAKYKIFDDESGLPGVPGFFSWTTQRRNKYGHVSSSVSALTIAKRLTPFNGFIKTVISVATSRRRFEYTSVDVSARLIFYTADG